MNVSNVLDWFNNYDGPKSMTTEGLVHVCMIGYNVHTDDGRVVGKQAIGRDRWDLAAILKAYHEWERFSEDGRTPPPRREGE